MRTLYWFSGTGNSLAVARRVAEECGDARLVPIASLRGRDIRGEGAVGIVCPVYFYDLPLVVKEFLGRLDVSRAEYVFAALTAGGFPGGAAREARRLLTAAGRAPDAIHQIVMPGNYVAMYDVLTGDALARHVADARAAAERVAADVARCSARHVRESLAARGLNRLVGATFGRRFVATCRGRDQRFHVTDACTRCGVCARVCPVGNVELTDGRPHWLGHCEQCFACVHWCPARAIQVRGTASARRGRYHHPDASLDDLASQRG